MVSGCAAWLQVNEIAFVAVADLPKLGMAGLAGMRLLAACKTAFTAAVVMPHVTRTKQRQLASSGGGSGGRVEAPEAAAGKGAQEGR